MLPSARAASSEGGVGSPARTGDCLHCDLPRAVHHVLRHISVFACVRKLHYFRCRMTPKAEVYPGTEITGNGDSLPEPSLPHAAPV